MEEKSTEFKFEDFIDLRIEQSIPHGFLSCQHKSTNTKYFIKWYNTTKGIRNIEMKEKVQKEIIAGKIATHKNLMKLEGYFTKDNIFYFVFPFAPDYTLRNLVKDRGPLPEKLAFSIFYQILEGMHYLHLQSFLHRDIKPENIMVDIKSEIQVNAQLCDYNSINDINLINTENIGTLIYKAPEIIEGQKYSPKIDYWSLGLTYYEMLQGKLPWSNISNGEDEKLSEELKKFNIKTHKFEISINNESRILLKKLLEKDPEKRLDYWKIKKLSIFQHYLQEQSLQQHQDILDLRNKNVCYKVYKEEVYLKEANLKNWVKDPIQRIIHAKNYAEYGVFPCSIQMHSENELKKIEALCNEEIQLSSKLLHQNILPLHNYYYSADKKQFILIYPYGNGGRLSEFLQIEQKLSEKLAFKIFAQLADGLNYLHENDFVHCNIDSNNVNLQVMNSGDKIFSLIGYGKSNEVKKKLEKNNSLLYQPPEFINNGHISYQSDYWSLGILYYQMVKGILPWKNLNAKTEEEIKELKIEISSFSLSMIKVDAELEPKSKDLLAGLLQYNLSDRMGYLDIKKTDLWKKYCKKKGGEYIPEIINESSDANFQ